MIDIEKLAGQCGEVCLEGVSVVRVCIPLVEPFRISSGVVGVKDALLVRVSEDKAYGWGEASAMLPCLWTPTPTTGGAILRSFKPSMTLA